MIPVAEIRALEAEWRLREDVVEKDYVLGWVLAGVAAEHALRTWVFKGGTALRKCYYETYRFSEDLDFTILDGGPETPEEAHRPDAVGPVGRGRFVSTRRDPRGR